MCPLWPEGRVNKFSWMPACTTMHGTSKSAWATSWLSTCCSYTVALSSLLVSRTNWTRVHVLSKAHAPCTFYMQSVYIYEASCVPWSSARNPEDYVILGNIWVLKETPDSSPCMQCYPEEIWRRGVHSAHIQACENFVIPKITIGM